MCIIRKYFCILLCFLLLLFSFPINSYAAPAVVPVLVGIGAFIAGSYGKEIVGGLGGLILDFLGPNAGEEAICSGQSGDNPHHAYQLDHYEYDDNEVIQPVYKCKYCGHVEVVSQDDFDQAYDDYVETLPAGGVDSEGGLIWYPTIEDCSVLKIYYDSHQNKSTRDLVPDGTYVDDHVSISASGNVVDLFHYYNTNVYRYFGLYSITFTCPISGNYSLLQSPYIIGTSVSSGGGSSTYDLYYDRSVYFAASANSSVSYRSTTLSNIEYIRPSCVSLQGSLYLPGFRVIPLSFPSDTYNLNTRTTNFQGDIGFYVDGELQIVENQQIINETNNTYVNPVSGDTYDMTGWSYDYSERSYTIDLSTGDTVSVTYGDENITINEGGTSYTVYYVIQQPPETTDNPVLPDHTHHWTANGFTVNATCTENGYKPFICTECGEEYRDVIYATGHDWLFQELVPAVYDEQTGELVSSSYNIYYCVNCQETTIVPIGGDPPVAGVSELNSFAANLMGWLNNFMVFVDGKIDSLIGEINLTLDHLIDELSFNLENLIGELTFDFSSHSSTDSTGHDWEFIEFVPDVYDDTTGELVSSAYNLYKCFNCGETVQVPVSHPPDSSGSGSDSGSDSGSGDGGQAGGEDEACFHDWEFVRFVPAVYDDETGELVTSAYNLYQCLNCEDTVQVLIETDPDEVADDLCPEIYSWLERLGSYLSSRWDNVTYSVTSFFSALPTYFSDFTDFLTISFAVFPTEIKSGMVVFVLAFVFVGIIKVLRG